VPDVYPADERGASPPCPGDNRAGVDRKYLQTSAVTDQLRRMGVQFSLDDFGTGYANYSYIQQFNPEIIKIDKVFTFNIVTNARFSAGGEEYG
jgi:EAL domain-containing protein (putative c-di-GMP-specific phosphodiesterase class I)